MDGTPSAKSAPTANMNRGSKLEKALALDTSFSFTHL